MKQVDRESTFRGVVIDHGVSLTKNEYPQWNATLLATEIWDAEEQIWVDWTDVEENGAIAYQVMFGSKGETLNCAQIKKITGWDGESFTGLARMDLADCKIQFRMEYNAYEGKTTLQVAWIDEYDATPGTAVKKLDAEGLKKLDAIMKGKLKKSAPATVPAGKPASPGTITKKGAKPTQKKGPVEAKGKKKPDAPAMPPSPPAESVDEDLDLRKEERTRKSAWANVVELRKETITDEQLGQSWLKAIIDVSGQQNPDKVTDTQWYAVEQQVLEEVAIF